MSDERLPWAKFSWSAWETDDGLAMCSMAAQGFWMRLLCIASRNGGLVLIAGQVPTFGSLAKRLGVTSAEAKKWFEELKGNKVCGVIPGGAKRGAIFSRRMVRSFKNSENGKLGGPAQHRILKKNLVVAAAREDSDSEKRRIPPTPKGAASSDLVASAEVRTAFELWNDLAKRRDLPIAMDLSASRARSIAKRLREGHGLDGWRKALAGVEASAFCLGQREGDRPFRADLDFVCQTKSFNRLIEGFYGQDAKGAVVLIENWSPWPGRMQRFRAGGWWEEVNWGPRPGAPGCQVPEEYLIDRPIREDAKAG